MRSTHHKTIPPRDPNKPILITAGPTYLDIDAYACCVALAELLRLQGVNAIAYSRAPYNYSVCASLVREGQIVRELPAGVSADTAEYIVVDVSDPDFLKDSVPLERVTAVYDHHVGAEEFWSSRLGERACIEFIGAAATLIWREWKTAGLQDSLPRETALLLIAAILDNTLNLTASHTTAEDKAALRELCIRADITEDWCAAYFAQVQASVEADLKNALFGDIKTVYRSDTLPDRIAQLCVWDANRILERLPEIRSWFGGNGTWMINMIDIRHNRGCFICEDPACQRVLEQLFDVRFEAGVAHLNAPYLRKQILKRASQP